MFGISSSSAAAPSAPISHPNQYKIDQALRAALKTVFGYDQFRTGQFETNISLLGELKDVFVLMATGSGKSICYQLAPFALRMAGTRATTVIISPLISLMEDQVMSINSKTKLDPQTGMPSSQGRPAACFLGSSQLDSNVEGAALRGEYALVYLTPEKVSTWIANNTFQEMMRHCRLVCFAIDECHCVSEWGHDFRPDYRKLRSLRENYSNIPILALTATATERVQKDILQNLQMKPNAVLIKTTFNRPNLRYQIKQKMMRLDQDIDRIVEFQKSLSGSKNLIVYVLTRDDVDKCCKELQKRNVKCVGYHAGLPANERRDAHHSFSADKTNCIVATIAFGMGIDKEDVRGIVHYGLPKSLEGYYQETGRAGRDGSQSNCLLLWGAKDIQTHRYFASQESDGGIRSFERINCISNFANDRGNCRRFSLLNHFGESNQGAVDCFSIGGIPCDVCEASVSSEPRNRPQVRDFSVEADLLLRMTKETGQSLGSTAVIDCLMGKSSDKFRFLASKPLFGKAKALKLPERFWKRFHSLCLAKKLICEQRREFTKNGKQIHFSVFSLSAQGLDFLAADPTTRNKLEWVVPDDMVSYIAVRANTRAPASTSSSSVRVAATSSSSAAAALPTLSDPHPLLDAPLTELELKLILLLKETRSEIHLRTGTLPYIIMPEKQMEQVARERPTRMETMMKIQGMTEAKYSESGQIFVQSVAQFCREHNLSSDLRATGKVDRLDTVPTLERGPGRGASESAKFTLTLFSQGKTPEEIVRIRSQEKPRVGTISTVINHLTSCWSNGFGCDDWDWDLQNLFEVPKDAEDLFTRIFLSVPETSTLTEIVENFQGAAAEGGISAVSKDLLFHWAKLVRCKVNAHPRPSAEVESVPTPLDIAGGSHPLNRPITDTFQNKRLRTNSDAPHDSNSPLHGRSAAATAIPPSQTWSCDSIEEEDEHESSLGAIPETPPPEEADEQIVVPPQIAPIQREDEESSVKYCRNMMLEILYESDMGIEADRLVEQVARCGNGRGSPKAAKAALDGLVAEFILYSDKTNRVKRL